MWKAVAGIGVFVVVYLLTSSLDPKQRAVAATFAAAVVLWISEAIPLAMTALLSTVALVVTGALPTKDAFGAYGDQIILLFIGSFILAKAMEDSRLDRRLALWLLSKPFATRTASSTLLTVGVIACVISLFVSNTATTAMLLPIALTLLKTVGAVHRGSATTSGFMLMLTWGSSIAVGTIIGTPPNVIGVGLIREAAKVNINFVQWAAFAMPITVIMLVVAWLLLRPGKDAAFDADQAHTYAREELGKLGRLTGAETCTIVAFFVAIVLWILPGMVEYAYGSKTPVSDLWNARVPEAVAALVGAAVLFILPCKDTPSGRAMTWKSATKIEWGTVLLFAGGLALGKAAFDSGLAKLVGESVAHGLGANDVWSITALAIGLSIILSELASNTASATVMVPVAIAICNGAGVNPVPAALGAIIGANLGFMLPISTAPNAIVYSTGLVPSSVMIRKGLVFDIVGFVVTLGCLRVFLPLLGLA
jgi:solute carrier family 13 (sodium-dependent dicarboxylate transporter), member 2/3/5